MLVHRIATEYIFGRDPVDQQDSCTVLQPPRHSRVVNGARDLSPESCSGRNPALAGQSSCLFLHSLINENPTPAGRAAGISPTETTPRGRAGPFYFSVTSKITRFAGMPDIAAAPILLRRIRANRSDIATSRRGFTTSGSSSFNKASHRNSI